MKTITLSDEETFILKGILESHLYYVLDEGALGPLDRKAAYDMVKGMNDMVEKLINDLKD